VNATDTKPQPRRPQYGECPYCGAGEDDWCAADCSAIDPMDYR
jgi:hypothetical protein